MPYQHIAAQNPTPAPPAASSVAPTAASLPDEESLHQELRGMKKIYEDAVNSGDLKTLAPVFGPQTSGVVATNEEFHTLDEMQQIFDRFKSTLGPGYTYRVTLNPERSLIYGDIAVCRGTSDEYVKSGNGHEFNLTTRWTAVLRRENGQWHLLRSQVSMDPFHNPVTEYFFASVKKIYGGGGLAIGLVVGILLGYLLRGRKSAA
jgi:ketosteroid isomerase-like protein